MTTWVAYFFFFLVLLLSSHEGTNKNGSWLEGSASIHDRIEPIPPTPVSHSAEGNSHQVYVLSPWAPGRTDQEASCCGALMPWQALAESHGF